MISTIQSFFVPNTSQISRQSQQVTEEKEKKEKNSLTSSIAQKSIKPFEKQEGEIINPLKNFVSTTVITDYASSLPKMEFSYNPFKMTSMLSEFGKLIYEIIKKLDSNIEDPEFKIFSKRVDEFSAGSLDIIMISVFCLFLRKITKDKKLVEAPSYRSNLSIQMINQEIKIIAINALEEFLECYKRILFGRLLKYDCRPVLNSELDKTQYFHIGEDVEKIDSNEERFNYMIKIAPPELTTHMQLLKQRSDKACSKMGDIANKKYYRAYKFALEITDEILHIFLHKSDSASVNSSYTNSWFIIKYMNSRIDKEVRSTIIQMDRKYNFVLENQKKGMKEYEREHGEFQI